MQGVNRRVHNFSRREISRGDVNDHQRPPSRAGVRRRPGGRSRARKESLTVGRLPGHACAHRLAWSLDRVASRATQSLESRREERRLARRGRLRPWAAAARRWRRVACATADWRCRKGRGRNRSSARISCNPSLALNVRRTRRGLTSHNSFLINDSHKGRGNSCYVLCLRRNHSSVNVARCKRLH